MTEKPRENWLFVTRRVINLAVVACSLLLSACQPLEASAEADLSADSLMVSLDNLRPSPTTPT